MAILLHWIPAFAGMTSRAMPFFKSVMLAKAGAFRYPGLFLDLLSSYEHSTYYTRRKTKLRIILYKKIFKKI